MPIDQTTRRMYEKQGYKVVGNHSAVKLCHWLRERLLRKRICYKQAFYGIDTHRCLQMTPALTNCTHSCLFCWRFQGFNRAEIPLTDDPVEVLDGAIEAQRVLITGYKGDDRVDRGMWGQAMEPNQVAISLTGEPTLYKNLGPFIEEAHRRNMTTFLVSNGTTPKVLEQLDPLPTQLYISITAPNRDIYKKLNNPLIEKGWERINSTLELLPSLDTRKVIRHTLVKGWNMSDPEEYAALDLKGDPHFIEPKGFVLVGNARHHFTLDNMPRYPEVEEFTFELSRLTGYEFVAKRRTSFVTLLSGGSVDPWIRDPEPFPVAEEEADIRAEEE